eukprot:g14720.t1
MNEKVVPSKSNFKEPQKMSEGAPATQAMLSTGCNVSIDIKPHKYSELKLPTQCCCQLCSFFTKMPDCVGCANSGVCCCMKTGMECKLTANMVALASVHAKGFCCNVKLCQEQGVATARWADMSSEGDCLFCFHYVAELDCGFPKTCCKSYQHCLCCDTRVACPCDQDLPFGCAICGYWLHGALPTKDWGTATATTPGESQVPGQPTSS